MRAVRLCLISLGVLGRSVVEATPQYLLSRTDRHADLNLYPRKPRLTFRPDGTFKITVFSDLHYGENPRDDWGPEQDSNSTRLMKTVLKDEKPDYAVLNAINGDLITGEYTFRENSTTLIDENVALLKLATVPFSSSHGNHDNEANITHVEEILREQKVAPMLSYTRMASASVGGVGGPDKAPALIPWFFDSRGGFSAGPNSTRWPDWVDTSVGEWILSETHAMNAAWGSAEKRGALAFVHIPPHVATDLQINLDAEKNPGLNADLLQGVGSVQATTDAANSGKDNTFWDAVAKNIENLHAVISGHDHGNEWCSHDRLKDVIFCFDKHSGYGGYSGDGWGYGVRNLLFKSTDPKVGVDTWIRMEEGETRARITLDKNYS